MSLRTTPQVCAIDLHYAGASTERLGGSGLGGAGGNGPQQDGKKNGGSDAGDSDGGAKSAPPQYQVELIDITFRLMGLDRVHTHRVIIVFCSIGGFLNPFIAKQYGSTSNFKWRKYCSNTYIIQKYNIYAVIISW